MIGVTTVRTGEGMTRTDTKQSTSRAHLRGVGRVDGSYGAFPGYLVGSEGSNHAPGPDRQTSVQCFGTLPCLTRRELEVFEDEDAVLGCPFDELLGRTMTEVPGSPRLLERQPFEGTNHASRVLPLCLLRFEFDLKPGCGLARSGVEYSSMQSGDEQGSPVGVYGNNRVGLVEIDANGDDSRGIRDFERNANVSDDAAFAEGHDNAIDLYSRREGVLECLWNRVSKSLSPGDRPYRHLPIGLERRIATALPDEKESMWCLPVERLSNRMSILSGGNVRPGREPNCGARQLAGYNAFDGMVFGLMQTKSIERLSRIKCGGRDVVADLSKRIERLREVWVILDDHLHRLLDKHLCSIDTKRLTMYRTSGGGGQAIPGLKTGVSLPS